MISHRRFIACVVVAVAALVGLGCSAPGQEQACEGYSTAKARFLILDKPTEKIDGTSTQVGRFELTNDSAQQIVTSGTRHRLGFHVPYPNASIQLKSGGWNDLTPMIGSFDTSGLERLSIAPGRKALVLAPIDFGVPAGRHEMRIALRSETGVCVVSDAFFHVVGPP